MSRRALRIFTLICVFGGFAGNLTRAEQAGEVKTDKPRVLTTPYVNNSPQELNSRLTITLTNAGVGPYGASAVAEVENANRQNPGPSVISLKIERLTPGRYELKAVRKSDGTTANLVELGIRDPSLEPDRQAGDSRKEDSNTHQVEVLATQARIELPADFDPRDFAQLMLMQVGGSTVLVGEVPLRFDSTQPVQMH